MDILKYWMLLLGGLQNSQYFLKYISINDLQNLRMPFLYIAFLKTAFEILD